ncbi:MAG TPA: preprotein translocase subunit SecY [Clostridiales bacterium]|nr:preprotein translocase subunit SecY [Clostridiales bacterium]
MFQTLKNAFKVKEIRVKIWMTLLFILIYRLGCYIPVPGIGGELISNAELNKVSYLGIMSMMTGGSLANGTWLAMGISPYINASIIIQLLTVAIPTLERISKTGEEGQKKINNMTRIGALLLAVIQSIGILLSFNTSIKEGTDTALSLSALLGNQVWLAYALVVIVYASGALVTVWIGERITEYGVSNGISILIFVGILSTAGQYFISMITTTFGNGGNLVEFWKLIGYIVALVVIFGGIVWVELAERRIPVQYAKQVKGRKMYGGQSTVIPIKVNANGVMPLIFAFSILSFPELIMTMFWPNSNATQWWQQWMGTQSWVYMVVLCLLILFFAFFYSQIQFNAEDISKTIQSNGGYILGYRPGRPTMEYLNKVQKRITLFGAIFLAIMALVPSIIFRLIDPGTSSVFSATGMLICVSVALEFNTALESQVMMKNYKGFLK